MLGAGSVRGGSSGGVGELLERSGVVLRMTRRGEYGNAD